MVEKSKLRQVEKAENAFVSVKFNKTLVLRNSEAVSSWLVGRN